MTVPRLDLAGITAALVLLAAPAHGGWLIESTITGDPAAGREQVSLQSGRMKTVMLGRNGAPATAMIVDLNAQTITQVDYVERSYMTATVQEYVEAMRAALAGVPKGLGHAEIAEAMKALPPDQLAMMREAMARVNQSAGSGAACREPRMELRRTGEQATIATYPAVRYDVILDGVPDSQVWIARGITAWQEVDRAKLERFGAEMAKLASACGPSGPRGQGVAATSAWKVAAEGYPVRTVDRGAGGKVTTEVVKAESRAIPAAEFAPPAGFTRRTMKDLIGR